VTFGQLETRKTDMVTKALNVSRSETGEARKTRALILATAERHFKHYGYAKTTIVEVARDCAMSHANVYRFFRDKSALVDAVAEMWLEKIHAVGVKVASQPGSAKKRLIELAIELHRMKQREHLRGARIHELLTQAARDGRPCIEVHENRIVALFAKIAEDGNIAGEFAVPESTSFGVAMHAATIKFCHPFLVDQYQGQDLEKQLMAVMDLVMDGIPRP
jgi:AcrR family transcriptional regulator